MLIIDDLESDGQALTFSGGEEHIKLRSGPEPVMAVRKPTSQNLMRLAMTVNSYKRTLHANPLELRMPYFPGARQDRIDLNGTALSLEVYADFINAMGFKNVVIHDAHSDVTPALVKNCTVHDHASWFAPVLAETAGPVVFLYPDAGAAKKYSRQYAGKGPEEFCAKHRDPETGKLSGFQVPDLRKYNDRPIWIIDDICDGGGTFLSIVEEIHKQMSPTFLGLAITHGIFSKGVNVLANTFSRIVTTNSIYDKSIHGLPEDKLTQIDIL